MKAMGVFDAKNRFSELCETVAKTSEPVLVTRRGKPLVRIVPVDGEIGHSFDVWNSVEEGRVKYGPIEEDFDLPERMIGENRASPLD